MDKLNNNEPMDLTRIKINGNFEKGGIYTLVHSFSSNVNNLNGNIPSGGLTSIKFKATAAYILDSIFKINNITYTVKSVGGESALADNIFVAGDIVSAEVDIADKRINFKVGSASVRVPVEFFGDGSDGDLVIESGQILTLPIEENYPIVKQYRNINIKSGGTLTTSMANYGLVLKCQKDCIINGIIDQEKKAGFLNKNIDYPYPTLVGGHGGHGGRSTKIYGYPFSGSASGLSSQEGGSGALGYAYGGGFSGAGGGGGVRIPSGYEEYRFPTVGADANNISIPYGGNGAYMELPPLRVASGGYGANGANGGGAVFIHVGGNFKNNGRIMCNGSDSKDGSDGYEKNGMYFFGGACGGSGGGVIYILHYGDFFNTGTFEVNGGSLTPQNTNANVTIGTIGAVKIEKFEIK